jgi:hypothetical protein
MSNRVPGEIDLPIHIAEKKYLTLEELKTLYDLLKSQYINYENEKALELIKKLRQIVRDDI